MKTGCRYHSSHLDSRWSHSGQGCCVTQILEVNAKLHIFSRLGDKSDPCSPHPYSSPWWTWATVWLPPNGTVVIAKWDGGVSWTPGLPQLTLLTISHSTAYVLCILVKKRQVSVKHCNRGLGKARSNDLEANFEPTAEAWQKQWRWKGSGCKWRSRKAGDGGCLWALHLRCSPHLEALDLRDFQFRVRSPESWSEIWRRMNQEMLNDEERRIMDGAPHWGAESLTGVALWKLTFRSSSCLLPVTMNELCWSQDPCPVRTRDLFIIAALMLTLLPVVSRQPVLCCSAATLKLLSTDGWKQRYVS